MRKAITAGLLVAACTCVSLALLQDAPRAQESTSKSTSTGDSESDLTARIDAEIEKVWKRDGVEAVGQCSDEEFLRRVYLDTVGVPPTYDEAVAFLDSKDKDKRSKLIDQLIEDPRFGQNMGDHWTVLLTPRRADALSGANLMAQWFADEFNKDTGFNTIIREIVTADGELVDNPAIVPYFADGQGKKFTDLVGLFSKNLMGVQIQCAECHDHPYDEDLSQKSFQGMAAFLTATQARVDNRVRPSRAYVETNTDGPKKILKAAAMYDKLRPDQKAQVDMYIDYVKPVTLDGKAADTRDPGVWRSKLAAWMIDDDNLQTRLYVANRIWSIAFGSGLLNPVDDFNPLNEASHPELLKFLADDLLQNKWSIKRLYRAMLKSNTYQLAGGKAPKKAERWHFASYPVRPLTSEQFLSSLLLLLDSKQLEKLVKDNRDGAVELAKKQLKEQEAQQKKNGGQYYTYDHATMSRYGDMLNRMEGRWFIARWAAGRYASLSNDDEMNQSEDFTMSIVQALAVMNGQFTNALAATGKDSLLKRITERFETGDQRIDALYLTVLSRRPTDAERKRVQTYVKGTPEAEDLLFALLMTTEFATNH